MSIEQTKKQEQHVIQLGAKADGWVKGESLPVIAHVVNKGEKMDYYYVCDANEPYVLDVLAEGEYEVSLTSPVDKDGSIYEVPKTVKVKSEAEDKDGKDTRDELLFEFKFIAANRTDTDVLNATVKLADDAVKKGDEILTGANGIKVIELVKENAKINPNVDRDRADEENQKVEDSNEDNGETKPENAGGDGNNNAGGKSGANDQNQGGNGGGGSNSGSSGNGDGWSGHQCVHNWVDETTTVHHDAVYETTHIHHDVVAEYHCICNGYGVDIMGFETSHFKENFFNGCQSYTNTPVTAKEVQDEPAQKLVKDAWDEKVPTGRRICMNCGKIK